MFRKILSFIRIIIILFLLLFVINCLGKYLDLQYKQKFILKLGSVGKITFKYESPSGFLGDGIIVIQYSMKIGSLNEIKERNYWRKLDGDFNEIKNISEEAKGFRFPESGYYLLYDKNNRRFVTIDKDFFIIKHFSPFENKYFPSNYILAIIDLDNNILVYFEEDS